MLKMDSLPIRDENLAVRWCRTLCRLPVILGEPSAGGKEVALEIIGQVEDQARAIQGNKWLATVVALD